MPRLPLLFIGALVAPLCLATLAGATEDEKSSVTILPKITLAQNTDALTAPRESLPDEAMAAPGPAQVWPALVHAAGPYVRFRDHARSAAQTLPTSADDLDQVVSNLASYNGTQLARAFHANAVLLAMQTPAFSAGVRHWANTYDQKTLIRNLQTNAAYSEQIPGRQEAVAAILDAALKDGEAMTAAGEHYRSLAYTLQHQKWAKKIDPNKPAKMAALRAPSSSMPTTPERLLRPLMQSYIRAFAPPSLSLSPSLAPPSAPLVHVASAKPASAGFLKTMVQRIGSGPAAAATVSPMPTSPTRRINPQRRSEMQGILALAALQLLDPQTPYPATLSARNAPTTLAGCVNWARLHLNQCIAATHFVYESSFCIARHQLKDSGQCIAGFVDTPSAATH